MTSQEAIQSIQEALVVLDKNKNEILKDFRIRLDRGERTTIVSMELTRQFNDLDANFPETIRKILKQLPVHYPTS